MAAYLQVRGYLETEISFEFKIDAFDTTNSNFKRRLAYAFD